MVSFTSLIYIGLIISIFFGQLLRLNLESISFPVIDIFIILLALITPKTKPQNKPLLFFIIFAWASLLTNYFLYQYPIIQSTLYLIRLSSLVVLLIYPTTVPQWIKKFLVLALIANITFGLLQYFLWPDFTYFKALGWDDHLNRLISTYFDPTFTGLIYLMFLLYLLFNFSSFPVLVYYFLLLASGLAIALTYSRSTFLSLFTCLIFLFFRTKKFLYLVSCFMLLVILFLLPRSPGEGTKLERTSSINAKIANYQEAVRAIVQSPIIGHGYNNLPIIRQLPNNHSQSGFDSSLLTILATTGILGFGLWILGFLQIFKNTSLFKQTLLVAIFIHSLFANSLLYPWILILFILF